MNEIMKIGCPICGAILSIKNQPGIESKSVTCPVCKTKSPIGSFKKIVDTHEEEHTLYADEHAAHPSPNFTLGKIYVPSAALSFQLKPGKNIIGRKAGGSSVHIQIPCAGKRMSREHLLIEIKEVHGIGFVHYASLNKEHVNPTYIGDNLLEYGDTIILKHRDILKLPDMDIRFDIPDEEGTEL